MDEAKTLRVAFTDFVFESRQDIHLPGFEFSIHPPLRAADEIIAAASDADILCMRDQFGQVTRQVFQYLPKIKLIVTRSAGYDHIDLEEARQRGIPVCHVPDYGAHMIAEQAFGLLLAVARNIVRGDQRYKQEHVFSDQGLRGIELYGKTLGVVGTGRIGMHTICVAKGFGMKPLANDVNQNMKAAKKWGFQYVPLETLLTESDFVTLHTTLTKNTHHLINAERLALMKSGAILVNTARGAVVDTQALIASLRIGHLGGAGLDVLENERDTYHDFGSLNVVVTPHQGWYTDGAVARILQIAFEILRSYQRNELIHRIA
ncbi:MAG: NAD(P)-dependent oxidoreductase [Gammaproteobacteria bacterium]|jgi:D-lactate dehydrogenase|nr:NAD(P)-dependent oxidoreductase [Gammaproteobacteria bacterium]|tara:strand:+ start:14697 stop:15650 length:954 start_codon:yes stop_codon:yes gene_type:complete